MGDENARLVGAELFTHTNDDNKDHDTGITVYVRTTDGKMMLATCYNADGADTEYVDGSEHLVPLQVTWGANKAQCRNFHVRMSQRTNGRDTWKLDARVTLYFSDGENLVAEQYGIKLKNNGASVDFDAP